MSVRYKDKDGKVWTVGIEPTADGMYFGVCWRAMEYGWATAPKRTWRDASDETERYIISHGMEKL